MNEDEVELRSIHKGLLEYITKRLGNRRILNKRLMKSSIPKWARLYYRRLAKRRTKHFAKFLKNCKYEIINCLSDNIHLKVQL